MVSCPPKRRNTQVPTTSSRESASPRSSAASPRREQVVRRRLAARVEERPEVGVELRKALARPGEALAAASAEDETQDVVAPAAEEPAIRRGHARISTTRGVKAFETSARRACSAGCGPAMSAGESRPPDGLTGWRPPSA